MTAQIPDLILYKNEEFALAGIDGDGFFDPSQYGMKPTSWCSACWRGFIAYYRIKNNELQLNKFKVSLSSPIQSENGQDEDVQAPVMGGYSANNNPDGDSYFFEYEDMSLLIPFTGGLLLAYGFIEELYVHMGFHPAWKFQTVHELLFEEGHLVGESDLSEKMANIRLEMKKDELRPDIETTPTEKYLEWIAQCFTRNYGR